MDVIIIKGTPGSGKSETSMALSKYFPGGVRIEVDTIHAMVNSPDWLNQHEQKSILQITVRMAFDFLKLNFNPVMVVDTFGRDNINFFLKELYAVKSDVSVKVFGLYVMNEELKRRLEIRPDDMYKDFETSKMFNEEIINTKNENETLFDTTYQTPEKTALKIYDMLDLDLG